MMPPIPPGRKSPIATTDTEHFVTFSREFSVKDINYPNTWRPLHTPLGLSATIVCPNGHFGTLENHDIGRDGKVAQSVLCHEPACDFHAHLTLGGWVPA